MKASTGKDILEQAKLDVAKKYDYYDWNELIKHESSHVVYYEEASLLAMERIAEMSWDGGKKKGHWEGRLSILNLPGCNYASGDYMTGAERNNNETPDKSTYMNNLFEKAI